MHVDSMIQRLNPQECSRANRFKFKADRHRYILAHGCLRIILSMYLECPAEQIIFIGVYSEGAVGVDVEKINPNLSLQSMPSDILDNEEWEQLFSLAPDHQRRFFFQLWTQKEAFVKAQGIGVTGLSTVKTLRQSQKWSCQSLDLGVEYCASVVFELPSEKSSLAQPTPKIRDAKSILAPPT